MLGNFFNNLYYGKAGKADFNPENLPTSRIALFFQMLRVYWADLIKLNLLYVIFCLPAILWTLWSLLAMQSSAVALSAGEITAQAFSEQIGSMLWLWLLGMFPCILITGPATAGVTFVTRNWTRDEHSFLFSDFKDAFKGNWKQALFVSFLSGVIPVLLFVCYRFYGSLLAENGIVFIIPQMLTVMIGVIWLLATQVIYMMMVTYNLSLKNLVRNAVILAIGKLPLSVGIRLASLWFAVLAVAVAFLFPSISSYALLALVLYYLIFGLAFDRFLFSAFANAICERYINPRIEGAKVGMGLRQTTEDDYEIDPTMPQPTEQTQEEK